MWIVWVLAAAAIVASFAMAVALVRSIRRLAPKPRPCYRCGDVEATVEHMNLAYCRICRDVVLAVFPAVSHDPPFGFPGAAGHVEFAGRKDR